MRVGLFEGAFSVSGGPLALRRDGASSERRRRFRRTICTALIALTFAVLATDGHAQQPNAPVEIPIHYYYDPTNTQLADSAKIGIQVGINSGTARAYIFDTGSPVFNAAYGTWWGSIVPPNETPGPTTNDIPGSQIDSPTHGGKMNSAQFCYGKSELNGGFCRGWTGNLVQVQTLDFYDVTGTTVVSTLSTGVSQPGYVMNAGYAYTNEDNITQLEPFTDAPMYDHFWGVFGAGNFAPEVGILRDGDKKSSGYYAGGILGQTMVNGVAAQGYVVAANGQKNPLSDTNGPQQPDGVKVTIGGVANTPVTTCNPCVTVGLTEEMLGQFWAADPNKVSDGAKAAVMPALAGPSFQNPYSNDPGNNASIERGVTFQSSIKTPGGQTLLKNDSLLNIVDTGTPDLNLETTASQQKIDAVTNGCNTGPNPGEFTCFVNAGLELELAARTNDGKPIPGLPSTTATVTQVGVGSTTNVTYNVDLLAPANKENTIGISFFARNSVMYDLTNNVVGYTPFFVTGASLSTTGGPLIVGANTVWLGLAGAVSGAGGVTVDAFGKVQLSANNSYTGPTQILKHGDLFISGPASIASSSGVLNDGLFDISRAWSNVTIQNLAGSGVTHLGGRKLIIMNADGTFSGEIADGGSFPGIGGGLELQGGTLVLSGDSTYTGSTKVEEAAKLVVNGSIVSNVIVQDGGMLGGSGSVGGMNVADGGLLAPGNSIGTMTVNGNFKLKPGAVYQVEANARGESDKVIVKGTVNLTGATLSILAAKGSYQPKTDYVIIDNDGNDPVKGRFARIDNSLGSVTPYLFYGAGDGNDVILILLTDEFSFRLAARTRNQLAVAGALDRFPTDDLLFLAVLAQTDQGARRAYDALSGEIHASAAGTLADDSRYVREAMLGRLMQANHSGQALASSGPQVASFDRSAMALGYDGDLGELEPARDTLAFWTRAYGAWGDFQGGGNAAAIDRDLGGFVSGMDANIGGSWRAGLATGAAFSNVGADARFSSADVESFTLGGYLGGMVGAFALRGGGAWTWSDIDTSRAIVFTDFFEQQTASYGADTGQIFGEVAYPMQMGDVAIEPFGGLAYVTIDPETFREQGGALSGLRGVDVGQDVGYTTLGLRVAAAAKWGETQVVPHFSAAWQHAFGDITPDARMAFIATGAGFTVYGVPLGEDTALIDAGLDFALGVHTTAGVAFTSQFGGGVSDNGVKGRFTWLF